MVPTAITAPAPSFDDRSAHRRAPSRPVTSVATGGPRSRSPNTPRIVACVCVLATTQVGAQRLLETDGIELRGSARILEYAAGTCRVREQNHSDDEFERIKGNEGKPVDIWELVFSVHNGSGRWLDHLIARYGIESEWPPCTSWEVPATFDRSPVWGNDLGHIQRSGVNVVPPGETLSDTRLVVVFHDDPAPRFANWSVDFDYGTEGTEPAPEAATNPGRETQMSPSAAGPRPDHGPAPEPLCSGKGGDGPCWLAIDGRPGCHILNGSPQPEGSATFTGTARCTGGKLSGTGTTVWRYRVDGDWQAQTNEGSYVDGKPHGHWVVREADGGVHEGPMVDGEPHGHWVLRPAMGWVERGPMVNGKKHGHWVFHFDSGVVGEVTYVDGKMQDDWVQRTDSSPRTRPRPDAIER